jgi:hypothetical protein
MVGLWYGDSRNMNGSCKIDTTSMLYATMVRVPSTLQTDLAPTNWALLWGKMLALVLRLKHAYFQHYRHKLRLARKELLTFAAKSQNRPCQELQCSWPYYTSTQRWYSQVTAGCSKMKFVALCFEVDHRLPYSRLNGSSAPCPH